MTTWIYPGSFDPFTLGHANIAERAARLCDQLYVSVLINHEKPGVFSRQERLELARKSLEAYENIHVILYEGLLIDLVKETQAACVVRGLRSESDFRYEAEMAAANRMLYPDYEVLLLPCRPDLAFTSSGIVREVARFGGDISSMVPAAIVEDVKQKFKP
ncbi:MAG: pantetheine-phosphate adenylyltransferase [Eubacteriales bacterium]|nr:pantetheine-phosphate adenylyltransferase [Eubacteriales bacterium]